MKNKISIKKLINDNRFIKVISIVLAVISWFVISMTYRSVTTQKIRNIPITIDLEKTATGMLGLSVLDGEDVKIDIVVEGKSYIVGSLSADDFIATAQVSGVTGPGQYPLRVEVAPKDSSADYKIKEVSPQKVNLTFARVITKKFTLETDISKVKAQQGLMLNQGYPSILEVTVSGPEADINNIDKCVAKVSSSKTISETSVLPAELFLLDKNGNTISADHITISAENVKVTIPVLKSRVVPITVDFLNVPSSFDLSKLKYTLSATQLEVAGPTDSIDNFSNVSVRYIDFKTLRPGNSYELNIELPSGYLNLGNITTVSATITSTGMTSKRFNVTKFNAINTPSNFDATVLTTRISSVEIVGPTSVISGLSSTDIVAEIDLSAHDVAAGQYNIPVSISIPGENNVWAVGDYHVVVKFTPK